MHCNRQALHDVSTAISNSKSHAMPDMTSSPPTLITKHAAERLVWLTTCSADLVLPVPGGPCTSTIGQRLSKLAATAACCEVL
jgi:hypothetical protein